MLDLEEDSGPPRPREHARNFDETWAGLLHYVEHCCVAASQPAAHYMAELMPCMKVCDSLCHLPTTLLPAQTVLASASCAKMLCTGARHHQPQHAKAQWLHYDIHV